MLDVIHVQNLSRQFGTGPQTVRVLWDINLQVRSGEFVAIMGPSGSGKSTLLQLIGGLDRATSGRIFVAGQEINKLKESDLVAFRRRTVAYVFQQFQLISVLTARENVALPLQLAGQSGVEVDRQVDAVLAQVGLAERANHRPAELSGGQQQRVALARALVVRPAVLLADEPTGNLDSVNSRAVRELLRQACDELKQTVVMVTHDPESSALADRVLYLQDGRIIREEVNRRVGIAP
ncbi:MAG: ABC transporter ATP-binding protein [Bacillota bacterium]